FHFFWKKGVPVVITGLPVPEAGPRYFITNFPELKAMIENCNGVNKLGDICEILVKECFIDFRHSIDPNILWKVKDWPPQATFKDIFDRLFHSFIHALSMPDICRFDGVLNFVSHFPDNGLGLDLGKNSVPKAYVAQGTRNSNPHPGSTILHMDLTSAVNVMVWTDNIDSKPGYAIWYIFAPEDADTLHKFLCDDLGINDVGDPIHAQCVCLTPSLLERLYSSYKICPHEIRQYHRDAIFIPAGCAHQVCMQALYRRGL
ncbi:hypothetical protein FIBSPDRAFT_763540, partial [Athelia psychrophila]